MQTKAALYFRIGFFLISIAEIASHAYAASTPTKGESLDELHEKTKKEGGKLNLYASLSGNSIDVILPAFQKRFPGVTVDHTDATGDKLIARIVAEGRGGRVIADVFGGGLSYIAQMAEQKLLVPLTIPEAAAYPAHLKNEFWLATDTQYFIIGWNSQLIEFLVAGQRPVCFTCYAHQFPPRVKKGAPIQPLLTEGVGEIGGSVGIIKGAPHPNTALLWARWVGSEEGQRVYAQAGETPAHPNVEPLEKVRPAAAYMLGQDDVKEFPKYEKLWKEIFQIR
jgi:ABC-type Fe3+ transport system substrate-binding protein